MRVSAWGGADSLEGATEPPWKNESDCSASCAIRDETSRARVAESGVPSVPASFAVALRASQREDAEPRHGRTRRRDLEKPGASAGGCEARGGGHSSMKRTLTESAL